MPIFTALTPCNNINWNDTQLIKLYATTYCCSHLGVMSHTTPAFSFSPIGSTPMSLDQSPFTTPRENQSPSPTFSFFGSNVAAPSQNFRDTPLPLLSTPNINPLAIDILAKDFNLEPVQWANLHAFIQVCVLPTPIHFRWCPSKDRFSRWDPVKVWLTDSGIPACNIVLRCGWAASSSLRPEYHGLEGSVQWFEDPPWGSVWVNEGSKCMSSPPTPKANAEIESPDQYSQSC